MEPRTLLNQILYSHTPRSIVCCGEQASRLAAEWSRSRPETKITQLSADEPTAAFPLESVHDIALVSDTLELLSPAQGKILLGQLRNAGARRVAVIVETNASWQFADFIGMGFKRLLGASGEPPQSVYAYDIANYNHKRQWNNAEHWANPEQWDKSRF